MLTKADLLLHSWVRYQVRLLNGSANLLGLRVDSLQLNCKQEAIKSQRTSVVFPGQPTLFELSDVRAWIRHVPLFWNNVFCYKHTGGGFCTRKWFVCSMFHWPELLSFDSICGQGRVGIISSSGKPSWERRIWRPFSRVDGWSVWGEYRSSWRGRNFFCGKFELEETIIPSQASWSS